MPIVVRIRAVSGSEITDRGAKKFRLRGIGLLLGGFGGVMVDWELVLWLATRFLSLIRSVRHLFHFGGWILPSPTTFLPVSGKNSTSGIKNTPLAMRRNQKMLCQPRCPARRPPAIGAMLGARMDASDVMEMYFPRSAEVMMSAIVPLFNVASALQPQLCKHLSTTRPAYELLRPRPRFASK